MSDTRHWLPAAPFRSHVRSLIDASGLPWRAVALHAGVPPATVRTLLLGRGGRGRPKLPRTAAHALLEVTEQSLAALRRCPGRRSELCRAVSRLLATGLSVADVAVLLRVPPGQIRALMARQAVRTDAYTVLLARAACDAHCPDDSEPAYDELLLTAA